MFLTISIVLCLNGALAIDNGPRIVRDGVDSVKDPIIEAGANYTLACEGSRGLEWSHPEDPSRSWTTFSTTDSDDGRTYNSVLRIVNMSYPFVGYYSCRYRDDGASEEDRIYLYVNDPEHLSVDSGDAGIFSLHYAIQSQDTTLPCRPTAPDIAVELLSYNGDEIDSVFDPKTGFTFRAKDITFEGVYICQFTRQRDDKQSESQYNVKIDTSRAYLAKPYIKDVAKNHTEIGDKLNLTCYVQDGFNSVFLRFNWTTPRGSLSSNSQLDNVVVARAKKLNLNGTPYLASSLIVKESDASDSGLYTCTVSDMQGNVEQSQIVVAIHAKDECSIDIREKYDQVSLEVDAGQSAQWILLVKAHPKAHLTWYDNRGNVITNNERYNIGDRKEDEFTFSISNVTLEDDGRYRVRGIAKPDQDPASCSEEVDFHLTLTVYEKPVVCLSSEETCVGASPRIYSPDEDAQVECLARGNPLPKITWENQGNNILLPINRTFPYNYSIVEVVKLNTSKDGLIKCIGSNSLGDAEANLAYFISDVKEGLEVSIEDRSATIVNKNSSFIEVLVAENGTFAFSCRVCPKLYSLVDVFFNETALDTRYEIRTINDTWSTGRTAKLKDARLKDSGTYTCLVQNQFNGSKHHLTLALSVKEPEEPVIWDTNLRSDIVIDYPHMMYSLYCNVSGIPKPEVRWYKDGLAVQPSRRILLENEGTVLHFNQTEVEDEGIYRCEGVNSLGRAAREASLTFKVKPMSAVIYYITGTIGALLLVALVYIFIRRRKEQALRRELKLLGLENFHKGNPENLNPELGIDDQADLLPYNKKWEFPIDQLKLGKQLGSGAFGVVVKGEARGIVAGEPKTTVAVKMVKKNADQSYIKALASELKIMVHLGRHINVVNLLGACTKSVAKRELLVIVEFCRYGNLQNYLFRHRDSFINQVDPVTGEIDYNIGADLLQRSDSVSSDVSPSIRSHSMRDYRDRRSTMTANTQTTTIGDDSVTHSNNSVQPEWRLNYAGDYRGRDVRPISTRDLVCWSFQVARGMEYLTSRKVLHGDLAARNILLADHNVVKICDFGLAKTMYNDNNYTKKGNSPLPVKWMAIESIRDRVFSTQSDVWSFGVVLWELFSLARTPYPGMEADERLYHKLVDGYRMESPSYAPREMYKVMLDCWNAKPLARPSFTKLTEVIGAHLEDGVRTHYVHLNDEYVRMNGEGRETDDYLGMLNPPSFDVLATPAPRYANAEMFEQLRRRTSADPEAYQTMDGARRSDDDSVFTFQPPDRRRDPALGSQELRPMLQSNSHESDNENNGYLMPVSTIPTVVDNNSVSNPSYRQFGPQDNYVTMPQYKNMVSEDGSDRSKSGSDVILDGKRTNAYYVNSDWKSTDV